jgi:hypothetical protein
MKNLFIAILCASFLYACTEAGEGSEVKTDSTESGKDTITQMNNNAGSATSKDTSSYDRQPTTQLGDSTRQ